MKVLLILEKFKISRGGAERSTFEMAAALTELGAEVTVAAGEMDESNDQPPFAVENLKCRGGTRSNRWKNFQQAVKELLARSDFDISHSMAPLTMVDVYQPRGGSVAFSARRHCFSYESALVRRFKLATLGFNRARQRQIEQERQICQMANGPVIAALSNYVCEQFRSEYQIKKDRLRLIANGVATEPFRCDQARTKGSQLRSRFDPDNSRTLLVFAAENLRLKGLRCLIEAGHELKKTQDRDFRIFVVSSGNYHHYWQLAQKLELGEQIIFLGSTREMAGLLNMCDGVVLPTYNDACSRVVLEALAAGKPAITSKFNGAVDFLVLDKHGLVIDENNRVHSLAQAMAKLCDPQVVRSMSSAIEQDKLYEKVSMHRHGRELIELYEEIIRQRSS